MSWILQVRQLQVTLHPVYLASSAPRYGADNKRKKNNQDNSYARLSLLKGPNSLSNKLGNHSVE